MHLDLWQFWVLVALMVASLAWSVYIWWVFDDLKRYHAWFVKEVNHYAKSDEQLITVVQPPS